MALTNISKEHLDKLLVSLNQNEIQDNLVRQAVQRNSNNYGKLKTLFRQLNFIQNEIKEIIEDSIESAELDKINCRFQTIPGNHYYLYRKLEAGDLYFSMLAPEEWKYQNQSDFCGKYLYDYDLSLQKLES